MIGLTWPVFVHSCEVSTQLICQSNIFGRVYDIQQTESEYNEHQHELEKKHLIRAKYQNIKKHKPKYAEKCCIQNHTDFLFVLLSFGLLFQSVAFDFIGWKSCLKGLTYAKS